MINKNSKFTTCAFRAEPNLFCYEIEFAQHEKNARFRINCETITSWRKIHRSSKRGDYIILNGKREYLDTYFQL